MMIVKYDNIGSLFIFKVMTPNFYFLCETIEILKTITLNIMILTPLSKEK